MRKWWDRNRLNSRLMTLREKRVEGRRHVYGMTIFDTLKVISAGIRLYFIFFNKLMAPLLQHSRSASRRSSPPCLRASHFCCRAITLMTTATLNLKTISTSPSPVLYSINFTLHNNLNNNLFFLKTNCNFFSALLHDEMWWLH